MDISYASEQRRAYEAATRHDGDARFVHTQLRFFDQRRDAPDWSPGPFARAPELTFAPTTQWPDPSGIGWEARSIFNPTLVEHRGELHLFYRAAPSKESLASRIGHAAYAPGRGWLDSAANPVLYPTLENEVLGVEDPKLYAADGSFALFYTAHFPVGASERARYPSTVPIGDVGVDVNLALSDDLVTWTKVGPVIDRDVTRCWAKAAVIPRSPLGEAVKIDGEYLMFVSEGCGGRQHIGRSRDLRDWSFEPRTYIDPDPFGGTLHEVATALVVGDKLILDFFYSDDAGPAAGQALYSLEQPTRAIEYARGGTLAWGGLISWTGRWLFAQGWDAPPGTREMHFYTTPAAV